MAQYADRYSQFRTNGMILPVFGTPIIAESTDKTIVYRKGRTRLGANQTFTAYK